MAVKAEKEKSKLEKQTKIGDPLLHKHVSFGPNRQQLLEMQREDAAKARIVDMEMREDKEQDEIQMIEDEVNAELREEGRV